MDKMDVLAAIFGSILVILFLIGLVLLIRKWCKEEDDDDDNHLKNVRKFILEDFEQGAKIVRHRIKPQIKFEIRNDCLSDIVTIEESDTDDSDDEDTEADHPDPEHQALPKSAVRKHLFPDCHSSQDAAWFSSKMRRRRHFDTNHVFKASPEDFHVKKIDGEFYHISKTPVQFWKTELKEDEWISTEEGIMSPVFMIHSGHFMLELSEKTKNDE